MATTVTFKLVISKVNELLFSGDIVSVTLPGTEGELTVLSGHEALITLLKEGTITVRTESETKTFEIKKGVCEIHNDQVTVLV